MQGGSRMSSSGLAGGAAAQFLQTVVVVDDRAYENLDDSVGEATLGDEEPGGRAPDFPGGEFDDAGNDDLDGDLVLDPEEFATRTIVDGFADEGISCSVLAPSPNDESRDYDRLLTLASRSDVVVLDWTIRPSVARTISRRESQSSSATSLSLILGILQADAVLGSRLRLICVYTGESDFARMMGEVSGGIEKTFPDRAIQTRHHRIDFANARIVFLSKERPIAIHGLDSVNAHDLPVRVVKEFTDLVATGLLPELALNSLSAIRMYAHRLLARFSHELDPALLSHRALTSSADAHQFALALIGDELGALAASAGVGSAFDSDRIERYLDARMQGRVEARQWMGLDKGRSKVYSIEDAKSALLNGVGADLLIQGSQNKKVDKKGSLTSFLFDDSKVDAWQGALTVDYAFAKLSSMARDRAYEGSHSIAPLLQLGAILRESKSFEEQEGFVGPKHSRYWICFQPLCDGVRLHDATAFPLLPLSSLRKNQVKFDLVVHHEGHDIPLEIRQSKLAAMDLPKFHPTKSGSVAAAWSDQDWVFVSQDNRQFAWMGNVRLDKAHKLLHSIVNTAGRIGIDEYEYYRRQMS